MRGLRAILGIAFIVAVVYGVYLLVPPYYNNYQFQDTITDVARMNTYTSKSEDEMRDILWRRAHALQIPINRDQIRVQREGGSVTISADYTVHIDMPGYPLDLQFHPSSKNSGY
jgi:hypothetical protein